MARDDACLKELPDDPFHPFMVAFEDKLCEVSVISEAFEGLKCWTV